MIFSIILVSLPTGTLTYLMIKNLELAVYIPLLFAMYYFYLFSTIFLFVAGASDPGIFERNYV
jgi:hypothetical protein